MTRVIASGPRVVIRHPALRDEAEFLDLMRRSRGLHRPWVRPPLDSESFHRYVKRTRDERHRGFLVCERDGGAIVGVINISEIVRGLFQCGFLGYYVGARYAARGYMREAFDLVLRHAYRVLKLHRLEANVQPGNERSIALLRRLGFRKEGYSRRYLKIGGRWQDHERWALLAEEWSG